MRAVVLEQFPGPLRVVDDWPEPQPGSGQVVVQVRGVGICGSDLALLAGHRPPPALPWVPGHESTGDIVGAGPGADASRIGQRVIIEPNFPCLSCPACRAGRSSACPHRISLGFNAPGVLAERIAVPAQFAWPARNRGVTPTRSAPSRSPWPARPSGGPGCGRAAGAW